MTIQTAPELDALTLAGRVAAEAREAMRRAVRPGISTGELDAVALAVFRRHGARSAPALVYRFPGVTCISVNDEVVHGIPGPRALRPGDLVTLDVTVEKDGFMADTACTVIVGGEGGAPPPDDPEARRLRAAGEAAFRAALPAVRAGGAINEVGRLIEAEVSRAGFSVAEDLHGHGIGRTIHESPTIPNRYDPKLRARFREGMVVTVEPILTAGGGEVVLAPDGWTVRTRDGSRASHHEHTMVVTRGEPILLTAVAAPPSP
jgi:methionyl aminopeptidase